MSGRTCPSCGAPAADSATFCEACGADLGGTGASTIGAAAPAASGPVVAAATPVTSTTGDESPLDVGWTGAVLAPPAPAAAAGPATVGATGSTQPATPESAPLCEQCGAGHIVDGYCDVCGNPPRDPRDHFTEQPSAWVAGACDIGRRHTRNEDGMALLADPTAGSRAVLVVCDGVSNTTDSHVASLAAARAAREVLSAPIPQGVGTRESRVAAIRKALSDAVAAADRAVEGTVPDGTENPPSATFVAAVVDAGLVVVGNVGDSRAYWLPDQGEPRQLSTDDSWAGEMIRAGIARKEAETGPNAHAITRWLGVDSPEDLTPHTADLDATESGWLLVCSDGLWNYCSEAAALRDLVASTASTAASAASVGAASTAAVPVRAASAAAGTDLVAVAQGLVAFANEQGGMDNITVALARLGGSGSAEHADASQTREKDETHG